MCENLRGANAAGAVRAFCVTQASALYVARKVRRAACLMFCWAKFTYIFLLNLFNKLNLCTSYIKQIMNVFSFVKWNKYFYFVKDEIFHSTRLHLSEWNISSFTSWKYLYRCTHKHSLFVYTIQQFIVSFIPLNSEWMCRT